MKLLLAKNAPRINGKRSPYKENGYLSPLLEQKGVLLQIQMLKDIHIVNIVLQVGQAFQAQLKSLALESCCHLQ